MDFSKFIEEGMVLLYEVRPDGSKNPRWDTKPGATGLQDYGYTDEYAPAYVELVANQKAARTKKGPLVDNWAAYLRLASGDLAEICYPGHVRYDPNQWNLPGYYQPVGGWGQYLNDKGILECTCGAVGWAKATNQPVPGHGPLCRITQLK